MYRQSEKKLAKQQYLPHMSSRLVNFGPLAAKIGSLAWGIPGKLNFNGFRVLAALYCIWHCSSGRQPNFAALNRGRHLYLAGWPSRWALAQIVVFLVSSLLFMAALRSRYGHYIFALWIFLLSFFLLA